MIDRFIDKVEITESCWLWTAYTRWGYGVLGVAGTPRLAHRISYEWLRGPIPEGLELDHLCRVRRCVNPSHLEPVTHKENMRRGHFGQVQTCPVGHPYDEKNTYIRRRGRDCRACHREQEARRRGVK